MRRHTRTSWREYSRRGILNRARWLVTAIVLLMVVAILSGHLVLLVVLVLALVVLGAVLLWRRAQQMWREVRSRLSSSHI